MENDYFRAKLSENLWEEGGGADPNERHSFLFHKFLTDALGIDLDSVKYEAYSHNFVQKFLNQCINENALESASFYLLERKLLSQGFTQLWFLE